MKSNAKDKSCKRRVEILRNLFHALDRSLVRYLSYARPWAQGRYKLLYAILRRMSSEQGQSAGMLAELIHERRGAVHSEAFPMSFTGYNDLSLEFLAPRLLEQQRELVHTAAEAAKQLESDTDSHRVVSAVGTKLRRQARLLARFLIPSQVQSAGVVNERSDSPRLRSIYASKSVERTIADPQTAA